MKKDRFQDKMFCLPDRTIESKEPRPEEDTQTAQNNNEPDFGGRLQIQIPKSLHNRLSELAEQEGVSLEQYILYKLTQ